MSTDKEQRILNVSFGKSGAGNISGRISLPTNWLKDMKLSSEEKQVIVTYSNNMITIKKLEKN